MLSYSPFANTNPVTQGGARNPGKPTRPTREDVTPETSLPPRRRGSETPSPHHGSRAPSLTPRRWIDALDATFHCEAPLRRPKPLSGEASLGRKPLFAAEVRSDRPGAEDFSVHRPLNQAGCRWSPALPGRTGKLGNLYACKRLCIGRWESLLTALCGAANPPGSMARTRWPLRSLPKSSVFRARGRIAVKAGRRPCPGASNNPKHRNGAASSQRLPSPTQNPTDKMQTQTPQPNNPSPTLITSPLRRGDRLVALPGAECAARVERKMQIFSLNNQSRA